MSTETPRNGDGAKLCAWCGERIQQSGVGRSKDYCRRSCRQRAYERRQFEKQLAAHRLLWDRLSSDSSRDEGDSSRDGIRDTSRDETVSAGPAPIPAPAPEYGTPVVHLVPESEQSPPAPLAKPRPAAESDTVPLPIGLIGMGFGSLRAERDAADGE